MNYKSFLASVAVTALPFAALADDSVANKDLVLEALQTLGSDGNVEAVSEFYAVEIIQHNDMFANGIEARTSVFAMLSDIDGFDADFMRVIADDDSAAVHAGYRGFGPTAMIAFDVFRFEGGLIVEYRDVFASMPASDGAHNETDYF